MNRLKSLDPPHKGLRNALSQLALRAGKTDYTSKNSIEGLKKLANEVFFLLREHTFTENTYILAPLEERKPGIAKPYFFDHQQIEQDEQELHQRFEALDGSQTNEDGHALYLAFCNFQAAYLFHINEEDLALETTLQSCFTDEELMKHQIAIMQEMSFETLLLWFKYIVPARRPEENAQVLSGFRRVATDADFKKVVSVIKKEISQQAWQEINTLIK